MVGIVPGGVEFRVRVGRDPERVERVFGAFPVPGLRVREEHLFVGAVDRVCDWFSRDRVDGIRVGDLVDSVRSRVERSGCLDRPVLGEVADPPGIVHVVPGHGDAVFFDDGVGLSVDGGVDAEAEDVLVEGCHDARVYVCAPGY